MGAGGHSEDLGGDGADNVIRFPRDWFGSKDDLVPFGPAADRLEAAAAAREQRREADLAEPLTADDFWGEGSGALHQPVGVPDVEARDVPELEEPMLPAVEMAGAPPAHAALPRGGMTLPSRGWLSGVAVVVMLICAVGIFALGRTRTAPTAAPRAVVHAAVNLAPGIDLSRQVDLLAARGMREAAQAVAAVERLRQPAPRRRAEAKVKVKRRAGTVEHVGTVRHATVTQISVGIAQAASVSQSTSVSDTPATLAATPESSSVTHPSSAKSASAKTESSSADSSPPATKPTKQSSRSSSASSSLASGPTTAGSAGSNCNPQCQ